MSQTPEERSETGKPMVRATPRDVVHIRLGSFVFLFTAAFGALALGIGAPVLAAVLWAISVFVIIDIALAVRRQHRMGGSSEGLE